jgi:hypothetical protein
MRYKKKNILIAVVLLILLILLVLFLFKACKKTKEPSLPYSVWEEIAVGVRKSPDHLKAQAERLVKEKDDKNIYNFVKNNFQTVPGELFTYQNNQINHGVTAAYRSGYATGFEKALILEDLLSRAGYKTSIHYKASKKATFKNLSFSKSKILSFDPELKISKLNAIKNLSDRSLVDTFKLDEDKIQFLIAEVDQYWKEKNLKIKEPRWNYIRKSEYVVIYIKEGNKFVANPSRVENKVYLLGEEKWSLYKKENYLFKEIPKVKISLLASYDDNKYTPFRVAEGEWAVDDIIGKEVQLSFKVLGPPDIIMQSEVSDIETFVPCIDIYDPFQKDWVDSLHISGDILTTRGEVVPKKKAIELLDLNSSIPSVDKGRVVSMKIEKVKLADFPTVTVEASIEDENGKPVMGLNEEDLNFLINGEKVTHRMVRNQVRPPKVMFVYDESRSIPSNYLLGKDFFNLFESLMARCKSVNPDTEINVACLGTGDQMLGKPSGFTSDVSFLKEHMKRNRTGSSNNWTGMASACNEDADILILISDADGTQLSDDFMKQRYADCIPSVILGIESFRTKPEQLDSLAIATKGKAFWIAARKDGRQTIPNADSINAALDYIKKFIGETGNHRYLIELDVEGVETPFLDLKMGGNNGLGLLDSILQIPVPNGRTASLGNNAITGLYLELVYKKEKYQIHLAGVPIGANSKSHPITQEMINACNNALLGDYILNIDVARPLKAILIDEICQHYLQLRKVEELLAIEEPADFFNSIQMMQWKPSYKGKYPLLSSLHNLDVVYTPSSLVANFYSVVADSIGTYRSNTHQIPFFKMTSLDSLKGKNFHKAYGLQTLKMSNVIAENNEINVFDDFVLAELSPHTVSKQGAINRRTIGRLQGDEKIKKLIISTPIKIPTTSSLAYLPLDIQHDNFLLQRQNGYLEVMNTHGSAGASRRNYSLNRDRKFIENEGLWNKSLGAKMETWGDLEGSKLALIQVGIAALDNMTELEDPKILMDKLKSKIKAYTLLELNYKKEFFIEDKTEDLYLELYNIAKNNLKNCTFLK